MPRGRMLKTKVREAKALEHLKLVEELKFKDKHALEIVKQNLIERLSDPEVIIRYTSIAAVAMIIKNGIDWSQQLTKNPSSWLFIVAPFMGLFAGLFKQEPQESLSPSEINEWVISLGVAYLIVSNFGDIVRGLGTAVGGILDIAKLFILTGGV